MAREARREARGACKSVVSKSAEEGGMWLMRVCL